MYSKFEHTQLIWLRPNQTLKKYLEWNILESGGIIDIRKDIKAS